MPTKVVHENGDKHIRYRFKVPNILENKNFLEVYRIENRKYQVYKNSTENMRTSMTKLKVLIEEELKKNTSRKPLKKELVLEIISN